MKKFKMIEKKDPYENISPDNRIVRRFPDIRNGIFYFNLSLISMVVVVLINASPIFEILAKYEFLCRCMQITCILTVVWSFPWIILGIGLAPFVLIRFIYNLIVKKVIGVDIYYDYISLAEYICSKIIDPIFKEEDDCEFDNIDYYDYNDDDKDDIMRDNSENDNTEEKGKIIVVDFKKREP